MLGSRRYQSLSKGSGVWPFFVDLLDLFYPLTCVECGRRLERESQVLCYGCLAELPHCEFSSLEGNRAEALFHGRIGIESVTSYLYFRKEGMVQGLMHELKYKGRQDIGTWIGQCLSEEMRKSGRFRSVDVVIPVPLHRNKRRSRGYNQVSQFGAAVADGLETEFDESGLWRTGQGGSQTSKNRADRSATLSDAFSVHRSGSLEGKHILIVDDIITTGSTLEACAQIVLELPGTRVSLASMAFTL